MDASLLSSFTSTFELMLLNVWVLSLIHLSKITHTWVNFHHPESTNYSTFLLQVTHYNGSLWMQRFTHYFEFNLLSFFCWWEIFQAKVLHHWSVNAHLIHWKWKETVLRNTQFSLWCQLKEEQRPIKVCYNFFHLDRVIACQGRPQQHKPTFG